MTNEIVNEKTSRVFGRDYIKQVIKELRKANKDSSGRLIQSLDSRIKDTAGQVSILIESEDYLTYVDEGRKRGSFPPIRAISNWARLQGISQEAVFPIAKSIYKFGIKPTNVLDKSENSFFNSNGFNKFEENVANDIEEKIFKDIEKQIE
jgi:phosphopantothenoylcysteine synthetase/decarboxylase